MTPARIRQLPHPLSASFRTVVPHGPGTQGKSIIPLEDTDVIGDRTPPVSESPRRPGGYGGGPAAVPVVPAAMDWDLNHPHDGRPPDNVRGQGLGSPRRGVFG